MCELFAMDASQPADVNFSLDVLAEHGGGSGPNRDGWGVVYYEDRDIRCIKDVVAAHDSAWLRFVEERHLSSHVVMAHIRRATIGAIALRNTQPFCRELYGRMHVFEHNGHLPGIENKSGMVLGHHRPVGDTDSEWAFCALLAQIEEIWANSQSIPPLSQRFDVITRFSARLRQLGVANFLYSDGEVLFAHGHMRRHGSGNPSPPGLHLLCRSCMDSTTVRGGGVAITTRTQQIVLVASVPLTEEPWKPLADGETVALAKGQILFRKVVSA